MSKKRSYLETINSLGPSSLLFRWESDHLRDDDLSVSTTSESSPKGASYGTRLLRAKRSYTALEAYSLAKTSPTRSALLLEVKAFMEKLAVRTKAADESLSGLDMTLKSDFKAFEVCVRGLLNDLKIEDARDEGKALAVEEAAAPGRLAREMLVRDACMYAAIAVVVLCIALMIVCLTFMHASLLINRL
jgi:hypothetical protein